MGEFTTAGRCFENHMDERTGDAEETEVHYLFTSQVCCKLFQ